MEQDVEFAWIKQLGGPLVQWDSRDSFRRHRVTGQDLDGWFSLGCSTEDGQLSISKHLEGPLGQGSRMLELSQNRFLQAEDDLVRWSSILFVREGRYVRSGGTASNFPAALLAAESHVHETREIGGLTWFKESPQRWVTWCGEFEIETVSLDDRWLFQFRGYAPSFEEAALMATLTGGGR